MVAHPRRAFSGDRWFALLLMSRLLGATLAVALLVAHRVTEHDLPLVAVTIAWTVVTLAGFGRAPALRAAPAAWVADTVAALALVLLSGDWRSPFYLFALTTLVLPATTLRWRAALAWSATFSGAYAGVALLMHKLPLDTIANTIRLETLATHLVLPTLVTGALAYASMLLSDLRAERVRSERMAVQAERQRIAWELHDSAKQRV